MALEDCDGSIDLSFRPDLERLITTGSQNLSGVVLVEANIELRVDGRYRVHPPHRCRMLDVVRRQGHVKEMDGTAADHPKMRGVGDDKARSCLLERTESDSIAGQ